MFSVAVGLIVLAILVSGCSGGGASTNPNTNTGSEEVKPAVHGTISTGTAVKETTMGITSAGGTVTVNNQSSPINGLTITVPSGAISSPVTFTVSDAPVTGNTFGNNFNPASPLITIDNGGGYAEDFVKLKIPVNASPDDFVMAFIYDRANQSLEGLYTMDRDGSSITVATLHFCDLVALKIKQSDLDAITTVDTGFKPGRDDFEFPNNGSYVAPGGHCAGQTVTMMWYYTNKRQKENAPKLNGLYDNNGREKTTAIYGDDVLAYRLASIVQDNIRWDYYNSKFGDAIANESALTNFNSLKYAMLLTGEPQYVRLRNSEGGHAIVGYAVQGDTICVADPNYPGQVRTITLKNGVLGPYNTGANAEAIATNGESVYPKIYYAGKTSMIPQYALPGLWDQFKAGTIGDGKFPEETVALNFSGANGKYKIEFVSGGKNEAPLKVTTNYSYVALEWSNPAMTPSAATKFKGNEALPAGKVTLQPGRNAIGFELKRNTNEGKAWTGFIWLEIDYQPDAATPTPTPTPAPGNERKPDRAARTVTVPAAPAPVQLKTVNNTDGSSQAYYYYKDGNGRDVTWGSLVMFWPGGKLKSESTRLDAKTIGYSRSYGESGKLIYEQYRDNDGVLGYQDYYSTMTGKLRQAIDYWPNGKEKDRYEYGDNGGPLQTYYEYDQAGTLKLKETWSNGRLQSSTSS